MPAVRLQDVSKSFGGRAALTRLNLVVERGDICGVLGPNGSGKTTTMRVLLGLLQADDGLVEVLGSPAPSWQDPVRRQVNALPESHGLYPWMRAPEYLRFFAGLYDVELTMEETRRRLTEVGLDGGDRRPIRSYSRGMKQRLGLARSVINDPVLLLLDEPTTGLDPRGRSDIHDLLLKMNRERGTTIILSTHILDDVERLCNRIAILDRGHLRYQGTPTGTSNKGLRYRFRLENPSPRDVKFNLVGVSEVTMQGDWLSCRIEGRPPSEVLTDLIEHGVRVAEAHQTSGGLEELYLANTSEAPQ